MPRRTDLLLWLLFAIVLSRLLTMAIMPMIDTTEPRYAEIARIMADTGDWITPWFDAGIPFWGKPPLSFWAEAFFFRLFGVTEFAARLPSWLANLGMLALIYHLLLKMTGARQALIGAIIFATMALGYVMSGAVLTDPFLALGTTLSLVSIILALRYPGSPWRWWFFVGLAIGLLAKGPLALVLVGGTLLLWMMWRHQWRDLCDIPWVRGMLLTVLLSLPWYVAAELKTPGFIDYFIVGEHFLRFVDPGWSGDLYGSAHKHAFGMIWLYWIWATFPWGVIALVLLIRRLIASINGKLAAQWTLRDEQRLLLLAALFPSLFFSVAGNILWTYQLPALAPFAMLLATLTADSTSAAALNKIGVVVAALFMPLAVTLIGVYVHFNADIFNTEKALVTYYTKHRTGGDQPLIYIDELPFSARFYAHGDVAQMALSEVKMLLDNTGDSISFLAIRNEEVGNTIGMLPGQIRPVYKNRRYTLLKVVAAGDSRISEDMEQNIAR